MPLPLLRHFSQVPHQPPQRAPSTSPGALCAGWGPIRRVQASRGPRTQLSRSKYLHRAEPRAATAESDEISSDVTLMLCYWDVKIPG